jgi:hypothetical protein
MRIFTDDEVNEQVECFKLVLHEWNVAKQKKRELALANWK